MNNTHKPPKGDDPVCELLPPEGNPPAPFPGTAVMAMATERFVAEVSRAISEIDAVKNGTANVTVTMGYVMIPVVKADIEIL